MADYRSPQPPATAGERLVTWLPDAAEEDAARPDVLTMYARAGVRRVPYPAVAGEDRDVVDAAAVVEEDEVTTTRVRALDVLHLVRLCC